MLEEGEFLYYYVMTVAVVSLVALCLGFCIGSCMFVTGATQILKLVEEGLKNLEEYTGVKTGAEANPDNDFYRSGAGGDGEERKQN